MTLFYQIVLCVTCKKPILHLDDYVEHHITYNPENKVPVHKSCHGKIHKSDIYPHLKPSWQESFRYGGHYKRLVKARINWKIQDYFGDVPIAFRGFFFRMEKVGSC